MGNACCPCSGEEDSSQKNGAKKSVHYQVDTPQPAQGRYTSSNDDEI